MEKIEFDEIRPYNSDEMPVVFEELLKDRQFNVMVKGFVPWLPKGLRNALLRLLFRGVKTAQDFQVRFMKPVVKLNMWKCTDGTSFGYPDTMDRHKRYLFMSNHRDIVLDSAYLDVMLHNNDFQRTCEIGIGDNLLIYPWIKKLVRMNKCFTVRRGLTAHEMMRSSILMSRYIHYAVNEKDENIWIAQREGRAKDSDDRTQDSVLKMFAMGAPESCPDIIEALKHLHIAPLTISYEFDPCDYLKAEEFQFKRDVPGWKKSKQDDLDNMKTGILGFKGRVHYEISPCIDEWLDTLDATLPKKEIFRLVAEHIDRQIHSRYRLYPCNWLAMDQLDGTSNMEKYTPQDRETFETYLQRQISKVKVPNPDLAFLRKSILTMYANPARNYVAARKNM